MRVETIDKHQKALVDVYGAIRRGDRISLSDVSRKHKINSGFGSILQYDLKVIEPTKQPKVFKWLSNEHDFRELAKKILETHAIRKSAYKAKKLKEKKDTETTTSKVTNSDEIQKLVSLPYKVSIEKVYIEEKLNPNLIPLQITKLEGRVLLVLLQQFNEIDEMNEFHNFIDKISDKLFNQLY